MPRQLGIHDCRVRYRRDIGLYIVSAIIYGGNKNTAFSSAFSSGFQSQTTIQVDLILDTGATYLGVKPTLFNSIRPRNVQSSTIIGQDGEEKSSQKGLVDIVVDGRLRVNDAAIIAIGELPYPNISGLLGMSFIQHFGMYFHTRTFRALQAEGAEIPLLRFHYYSNDNYEGD